MKLISIIIDFEAREKDLIADSCIKRLLLLNISAEALDLRLTSAMTSTTTERGNVKLSNTVA